MIALHTAPMEQTNGVEEAIGAAPIPFPGPSPIFPPFAFPVSGLYEWKQAGIPLPPPPIGPAPFPVPPIIPSPFPIPRREELRLDVDGRYPQMVASGMIAASIASRVEWIAKLAASGQDTWSGTIWYKEGDVATFAYTDVSIQVTRSLFPNQRTATVTFSGGGGPNWVRVFKFKSAYFHPVNFEFDFAEGEAAHTSINTCDHPNRPATLPCEKLTVETVFRRAGFEVSVSPGGPIPLIGAGANARWSDMEMHDAMQTYWSHFAASSQWALWTFFASLHEQGTSLGGIMFDDIGPNHRQGTAIFNDSFIATPPNGDPNPAAWIERMIFWTACHEMGHAFNLAHSWQKALVIPAGGPWIPLLNEPEARSFMNYPFNVNGGQSAFFADFEFRFSDSELLFLRHAPSRFVQMGNANWFDHHGFEEANVSPEPTFKLELRVNREKPIFEFMELLTLELKLTNISNQPQLVDTNVLTASDEMTVILKKDGKPARQFVPFAQYCMLPEKQVLMPGEATYAPLPISAGRNGWDIAEPGLYTVQIALHMEEEDILSNPLRVRVAPPVGYTQEYIAQDFFTEDVGRVLSFEGSRVLTHGIDTLYEVTQQLSDRRVALHASLALGNTLMDDYKELKVGTWDDTGTQLAVEVKPAQPEAAKQLLEKALSKQTTEAVESFGHIEAKQHFDRFSEWLAQEGETTEARKTQDELLKTMSTRQVHGRKVLDRVVDDIRKRRDSYKKAKL